MKEYREKHKEEMKEYREKNKDKIKEKSKEYYKKHKEEMKEHSKEYYKNLYTKAIDRICEYYNLKEPICFIDKKQITIRENSLPNYFLVIDHKKEQESNLKDYYKTGVLYNYIITCPQEELENYQLLCSNHNLIKHDFFYFYSILKNKNSEYTKEVYEMYNEVFIYDKGKLRNELIKEEKNI